jgi:prepilin signal peptidase PulO-like enzyme (type II secretory pathway)
MLCVYLLGLLLLFAINFNSGFLPDHTVLTLLWVGVLWWTWQGDPASSVLGAVLAYLVPFVLLWVFKAVKGIRALGGGDVKTLAMAGAWLGVGNVPMLLGVFLGLVVVVTLVEALMAGPGKLRRIGTGPGHLAAAVMVLTMPYLSA